MARQGRRDDSRSRCRGRTRNYRGRSRSRPSQPQHQRRQDSLELPRSWKSTPAEYDSNRERGLYLPRQVVSNMTGGLNNWGLRSLANGQAYSVGVFQTQTGSHHSRNLDALVERGQLQSGNRRRPQCDPDIHDQEHVSKAGPILVGQPLQRHQGID